MNDHPVGPVALYDKQGVPAKAPSTVKVWKSWETAIAPIANMGHAAASILEFTM